MPVIDLGTETRRGPPDAEEEASASTGHGSTQIALDALLCTHDSDAWALRIHKLKDETLRLRTQRQQVAKKLKAAQRKNRRLKDRARCLSEEDMLQILMMKRAKTKSDQEDGDSNTALSETGGSNVSPHPGSEAGHRPVPPPADVGISC